MDVKDFISQSLQEIIQGVSEAQQDVGGEQIAANMAGHTGGGNLINAGKHGIFTRVDFDVAVSAETSGSGGGNLKVFGVGIEGSAEHTAGKANRLTFSVPVRLPEGDQKVADQIKRNIDAKTKQLKAIRGRDA